VFPFGSWTAGQSFSDGFAHIQFHFHPRGNGFHKRSKTPRSLRHVAGQNSFELGERFIIEDNRFQVVYLDSGMRQAIIDRDFDQFGPLIEDETLEMHVVAMTSQPPICYLSEKTREFLLWLRKERAKNHIRAYFTLDAGPNVHVICSLHERDEIADLISQRWPQLHLICDEIGKGPQIEARQKRP